MTAVPFMRLYCSDFFGDPLVQMLTPEQRGVYLQLLMRMWMNGGWIANDDKIIARALGLTRTTWLRRYRPAIENLTISREFPQILGGILTQKRLERDWQITARTMSSNKVKMAKVRAERDAKSKQRPFSTEAEGEPVDNTAHKGPATPVDSTVHKPAAPLSTVGIPEPDKKGPGERPINQAGDARPSFDAGALRSATPLADVIRQKRLAETVKAAGTSIFDRLKAQEDGDGRA